MVDVALMAPVPGKGLRTPMLVSGAVRNTVPVSAARWLLSASSLSSARVSPSRICWIVPSSLKCSSVTLTLRRWFFPLSWLSW